MFVPKLKKNLLSISALDEKGMRVSFIDDAVVIGEQEGGIYKLKGQPEQALVHESVEPNDLWHRRFAHVHYRALSLASKDVEGLLEIKSKHDGVSRGCAKGKNTNNTFSSSESKAK